MRTCILAAAVAGLAMSASGANWGWSSTAYTRDLLRSADAAAARAKLGFSNTNLSVVTHYVYMTAAETNTWAGPTNSVDLSLADQYYDTLVPIQITGFANRSNTVAQSVVMTLRNLSGSNVTVLLPAGVREGNGLGSYTMTNGAVDFVLSLRYSPATGGHTNAVQRSFWGP